MTTSPTSPPSPLAAARGPRRRPWTALLFSLALPLLLTSACNKDASYTMSPEMSGDYAEELPPAPMVDITSRSAGAGMAANEAYDFSDDLAEDERAPQAVIAAPAKAEAKPVETPTPNDQAQQGQPGQDQQDTPDHGRQIVYTAGMQVSVYNLDEGMNKLEAMPEAYGGWVHMRGSNQVVLRVPARSLEAVMNAVGDMGVVEARSLQAQDVTAEYVDLESRIKVLRETQAQLLELLDQAKTVEEALHVRQALDDVTMELETALGRMRQLGDLIAFSTLTVTLVERGPMDNIPTSNDPFRWVDSLGVEATEWR